MYKYLFNYLQITGILLNFKSIIYLKKHTTDAYICKKTFTRLMQLKVQNTCKYNLIVCTRLKISVGSLLSNLIKRKTEFQQRFLNASNVYNYKLSQTTFLVNVFMFIFKQAKQINKEFL